MPFALDGNPSPSEISEAINYILANLSAGTPPGTLAFTTPIQSQKALIQTNTHGFK